MNEKLFYIGQLLAKQLHNELSEEESKALNDWLNESEENSNLLAELSNSEALARELKRFDSYEAAINREKINFLVPELRKKAKVFSIKRYVAAASIITAIAATSYFIWLDRTSKPEHASLNIANNDVNAPARSRATITLSNGEKVYLDSVANGQLAVQQNMNLIKLDSGKIAYQVTADNVTSELQYNTLSNPRGSQIIDMMLADGSHVWLNAGSSVTYPVSFIGNERKVNITGEAYFEIAHDANKPFKVSKAELEVEVLGTHFNVNAYDDQPTIKVTLLEGLVKVSKKNNSSKGTGAVKLKPGQQADGNLNVKNDVDLEEVMSWKNGVFKMNGEDIASIMRKLANWYDINVVYENGIPDIHLTGTVPNTTSLANALKMFEYAGLKFKIENRKLVIFK